jgi:hypothetical protein
MEFIMNYYNKYVTTKWEQLWADDNFVAVLYSRGNNDYQVLYEDSAGVRKIAINEFREALNTWNDLINEHLGLVITPIN